jgi:Domain of unknown function (DUF4386)
VHPQKRTDLLVRTASSHHPSAISRRECECPEIALLTGYLFFKSTFLPRILGVLMAFAGLGWLTFLSLPLANHLSPCIFAPGILGEGSLTLWLLVIGMNLQRWKGQASAAGESIRT